MPLRSLKVKGRRVVDSEQKRESRVDKIKRALLNRMHMVTNETLEESLGFDSVDKPDNDSKLGDVNKIELPRLSSRELSTWLQYCTGMHSFALVRLAEAENQLSMVSAMCSSVRARIIAAYQSSSDAKWKVDVQVDADPEVVLLDNKVRELQAVKTLTKAHVQVWDARSSMFSREVSRRASEKSQGI